MKLKIFTISFLCLIAGLLGIADFVQAQSTTEINQKIEDHKTTIKQLEEEAAAYQKELEKTGAEKSTLQSTIKVLDTTKKKLDTDIKVTQNNISSTQLTVQKLGLSIDEKNKMIEEGRQAIKKDIKTLAELDSQSFIETLLSGKSMSDVWNHSQALITVNETVQENIKKLQDVTKELVSTKQESEQKQKELLQQKQILALQQQTVASEKKEKDKILAVTKSKEANYQKLLADKLAQKEAFEKELFNFEQQLKISVDVTSYPEGKSGILSWPLSKIKITQYFGKTVSAKRLYVSGTHNGVDFGTSVGTPVYAALSGTVTATGNTDLQSGCYSYGKWVLIKHPNGLSTIYGHLSAINVTAGATLDTGDLIGLSGNTGYSTGPHLHFGLFATQGMRVQQYVTSNFCKNVSIPIADKSAYLDPMLYLPH